MSQDFKETKKKNLLLRWIPIWLSIPFVVFLIFLGFLLFFGENNYMEIAKQKKEINAFKAEVKEQEDSAQYYIRKTQELNTDKESLEKIAREQYSMKRTNEEVFLTDIK